MRRKDRVLGLADTAHAEAQSTTIRLKLLKVGARIRIRARKDWLSFSEAYPYAADIARIPGNLQRYPAWTPPGQLRRGIARPVRPSARFRPEKLVLFPTRQRSTRHHAINPGEKCSNHQIAERWRLQLRLASQAADQRIFSFDIILYSRGNPRNWEQRKNVPGHITTRIKHMAHASKLAWTLLEVWFAHSRYATC